MRKVVTPEKWETVNHESKKLLKEFFIDTKTRRKVKVNHQDL